MFLVFNYNQLEYTTFLINSYDSFWNKIYDYLITLKVKFLIESMAKVTLF